MLYCAFGLYPKLAIVAIGTMHNPDALDLLGGEGFNVLLLVAYQAQAANATPIGEGDVFAIRFNLPARMLVFHAPIVMLELRIALLAGLLVLAVLIEAFNGQPGSISRSLSRLRVEAGGKRILFGKGSTVALEVIVGDTPRIHPQAQALVPDELHHAKTVINGLILPGAPIEL